MITKTWPADSFWLVESCEARLSKQRQEQEQRAVKLNT
jgi:hypothetical protein